MFLQAQAKDVVEIMKPYFCRVFIVCEEFWAMFYHYSRCFSREKDEKSCENTIENYFYEDCR